MWYVHDSMSVVYPWYIPSIWHDFSGQLFAVLLNSNFELSSHELELRKVFNVLPKPSGFSGAQACYLAHSMPLPPLRAAKQQCSGSFRRRHGQQSLEAKWQIKNSLNSKAKGTSY
jgi:hypothetical protein